MSTETEVRTDDLILEITDEALVKVLETQAGEEDADTLALRVEVTGSQGVDYTYDLSFETIAEAAETDIVYKVGDVTVMIPADSVDNLRGATLDLPSNPMQGGLVIRNPNRPNPLEGKDITLEGTLPEKIQQLLDQQINPALAAHGGAAQLVGVEDTVAYVSMSGGCQGCSMSAATLRDGITVMISQTIPEITQVIDTTDHEAGDNPFFS